MNEQREKGFDFLYLKNDKRKNKSRLYRMPYLVPPPLIASFAKLAGIIYIGRKCKLLNL